MRNEIYLMKFIIKFFLLPGSVPSLHPQRSLDPDKSPLHLPHALPAEETLQGLHSQEPRGCQNCWIIYIAS